ncbi:hypothetical protein PCL_00277 [Purpureocillium lilacinum]|uniref:Uncharacterized protein n=1 Tax=Purpureocillium lilacinum TaxID=33203 RepID=A0A2U3E6L3_PURLI|nr:hypothetical protein PCL_00277 [Purpureocillium lilacinum]
MILIRGQMQSRVRPSQVACPNIKPPTPLRVAEDAAGVRTLILRDPRDQFIDVCWVDCPWGYESRLQSDLAQNLSCPELKISDALSLKRPVMRSVFKEQGRNIVHKKAVSLPFRDAGLAPCLFELLQRKQIKFLYCEQNRRPYQCDEDGAKLYFTPGYGDASRLDSDAW